MITGQMRNQEAIVEVELAGPGKQSQQIDAVLDTGYNGYLTLPGHLIKKLHLSFAGNRRGRLADGSEIFLDVFLATVIWHGHHYDVLVSQASGTPLIGMSLLSGSRLTIDVIDDGEIKIEEISNLQ